MTAEEFEQVRVAVEIAMGEREPDRSAYYAMGGDYDDDGMWWDHIDWESKARSRASEVMTEALRKFFGVDDEPL